MQVAMNIINTIIFASKPNILNLLNFNFFHIYYSKKFQFFFTFFNKMIKWKKQVWFWGVVRIKWAKNHVGQPPIFFKTIILLDIFLWCHFKVIVIMGSCVKWLIWVLKNSKKKWFFFRVLVLIKDLWTWTIVASKVINFMNY